MLIGLISDVHSNVVALKAVIDDLDELGIKTILHSGDIVGYNPYPDETIELFKQRKIISILGNHDRAFITGDTFDFNPYAAEAIEWTRNAASQDSLHYIMGLKDTLTIVEKEERIVLFHESLFYRDIFTRKMLPLTFFPISKAISLFLAIPIYHSLWIMEHSV
jgi:predicted phosphodiesterase